ncbi:MAG TPA: alpha/beta fold hydrolase [Methylophilaceae bacterium]
MMLEELKQSVTPAGGEFVTLLKQPDADVRLVCFHFAGGSAQSFLSWRQPSTNICELLAAELPGRSRRYSESFAPTILDAAESFADAYARLEPRKCVFYGHSLGALLAYETARILAKRGIAGPDRLVVSSRSAPGRFPASVGLPELSDASLMKYLRDLQGTKQSVLENKMLMEMMLPIIRADLEIIYGYRHHNNPVLEIPVDVIGATDDHHCPFELLLNWRNVTNGKFSLRMIPGGHFAPIAHPDIVLEAVNSLR